MKPDRVLEFRPAEIAKAFGVSDAKAKFNLKNGTAFSFWLQARLEEEFMLARKHQCEFRTMADDRVVIRMLTDSVNFAQSKSHGFGRPFIAADFLDFLSTVHSYLVPNLRAYDSISDVWRVPVYRVPAVAVKYWWNIGLLKVPITIAEAMTNTPAGVVEIKAVTTFSLSQAMRHFEAFDELRFDRMALEAVFDKMYKQSKASLKDYKIAV